MPDEVQARVEVIDGELVLFDPVAEGVIAAVESHNKGIYLENCHTTFKQHKDRIDHFAKRIVEKGLTPKDALIVIISADDPTWKPVLDELMPGYDWHEIRARGESPYGRGLAERSGIQVFLDAVDKVAGKRLREITTIPVLVVDSGIAAVFQVPVP